MRKLVPEAVDSDVKNINPVNAHSLYKQHGNWLKYVLIFNFHNDLLANSMAVFINVSTNFVWFLCKV
jgi:hypothetical protein